MEIKESFFVDVVYLSGDDIDNTDTTIDKITYIEDRLFAIIDGKVGIHENRSNRDAQKAAKLFLKASPLIGSIAALTLWFAPPVFITASLVTLTGSVAAYALKDRVNSAIEDLFPSFQVEDVKMSRDKILNSYTPGDLTELLAKHHYNPQYLQAYFTQEELEGAFYQELRAVPLPEIAKNFDLSKIYGATRLNLQALFVFQLEETYKHIELDRMFDAESDGVKALARYIEAYRQDPSLPSPHTLSNKRLLPSFLNRYIDKLLPLEGEAPSPQRQLFSSRLFNS